MELLVVEIDPVYVGFPTSDVKEVVRAARLTPAADSGANIKGLLNLRGMIVPIVSMRETFGLEERDILSTDHFIVLLAETAVFGVHVDRAVDILSVTDSAESGVERALVTSIPHDDFGIVHIQRACALWTAVGLSASADLSVIDRTEDSSLS